MINKYRKVFAGGGIMKKMLKRYIYGDKKLTDEQEKLFDQRFAIYSLLIVAIPIWAYLRFIK